LKQQDDRPFCQAKTRKQYEASTWAAAHQGCSRRGVMQIDGYWVCKQHADERKRYGWNGKPKG
jgi:hypothetical protein